MTDLSLEMCGDVLARPGSGVRVWTCLDLYCGAGGAGMGLSRAGFAVHGVDIQTGLAYPFPRRIMDALDADLSGYDFVWASPPCQAHCALRHQLTRQHECFIDRTREKLIAWGGPYIIENVPGAPLRDPIMLCGSFFGLRVRRHRIFESNVALVGSLCRHREQGRPIDVSGTGGRRVNRRVNDHGGNTMKPRTLEEGQAAMGIEWMTRPELAQAIPPAYSEFLGRQVMGVLRHRNEKDEHRA